MLDHHVRFETFIRDAFVKKEHILTIFFDPEKAYVTMWKHSILADLWDPGFRVYSELPIKTFFQG